MDKLNSLLDKIHSQLLATPEYQDYIQLQAAIDQSDFLTIENQLKEMQQAMTIALDENKMDLHLKIVEDYNKLKSEFDNHPLYMNYISAKRALNELIQEMVAILKF